MSEEHKPTEPTGSTTDQTANQSKETPDLTNELREMGQQLEAVFRAAMENERTKQLQRDIAGGVRELTSQVQHTFKTLQENPRVQQAEERGRQAVNQAQQSKVVQDLQEAFSSGITQINLQLRRLAERMEQEGTAQTSGSVTSQQVPIETEQTPPSTGATTKLDQ